MHKLDAEDRAFLATQCREFYIRAILKLQERFKFDYEVYKLAQMLKSQNVRALSHNNLSKVFKRFPRLKEACGPGKVEL